MGLGQVQRRRDGKRSIVQPLPDGQSVAIREPRDLATHPLRGAIFESFVVSEFTKAYLNAGEVPLLYHWRDQAGNELDLLVDRGQALDAWEVKSSETLRGDTFRSLSWWRDLVGERFGRGGIVFGGRDGLGRSGLEAIAWDRIG